MSKTSKTEYILETAKNLPLFSIDDLISLGEDKKYLRIFLHRLAKKKKIISLKRGLYVSRDYLDQAQKKGIFNNYLNFLGSALYSPSYLSLEYVLSRYNILTEFSQHFTLVTKNKTAKYVNELGLFVYHHVKDDLFCGFKTIREENFIIYEASKAKALFDFLYLRKNMLVNRQTIDELRLNLENLSSRDFAELEKYVKLENSKKLREIFNYLA